MKQGQAWGFDVMVAAGILIAGLIAFYIYTYHLSADRQTPSDIIKSEVERLADTLLTEGVPANWNTQSVNAIGILSNHRINDTKLEAWYNLSQSNYNYTRQLLRTPVNYFVNMSDPLSINGISITGIGRSPVNATTIMRSTRFTIYNNKPITLYVISWE